ncbi:BTB/POZ domain-containing protein 3-like isoform 2, partial [Aphelenchoides avenae]
FIYTGTTTIADAEVFPLLDIGKRYLVESLVRALLRHLEESLTAENVGLVIYQGQDLLDDAPFWQAVERHGEALLNSAEFLLLRKDTVVALLQRGLEVEENILYDKVVAWAKDKCARNELPVDAGTIRKELDGVIQLIRFPAMPADDFARGPAAEAILTAEEKVVFKWFTCRIPQKIFPNTPRHIVTNYVCDRFASK